jgi:hypothetical protein
MAAKSLMVNIDRRFKRNSFNKKARLLSEAGFCEIRSYGVTVFDSSRLSATLSLAFNVFPANSRE